MCARVQLALVISATHAYLLCSLQADTSWRLIGQLSTAAHCPWQLANTTKTALFVRNSQVKLKLKHTQTRQLNYVPLHSHSEKREESKLSEHKFQIIQKKKFAI